MKLHLMNKLLNQIIKNDAEVENKLKLNKDNYTDAFRDEYNLIIIKIKLLWLLMLIFITNIQMVSRKSYFKTKYEKTRSHIKGKIFKINHNHSSISSVFLIFIYKQVNKIIIMI